jgi:hypothetical protein
MTKIAVPIEELQVTSLELELRKSLTDFCENNMSSQRKRVSRNSGKSRNVSHTTNDQSATKAKVQTLQYNPPTLQ